ncbi:pyrroline-5-carboxylate reductase [Curvibacter sp. APW13]|uniref:pyrroline-5-carboxylate reductase n=1 Tax=Curvibacter sp. APW13 TaxID=3077236 RepID=UPI0028DF129E|nr:pyrroline-5-carboxylate reductase [Curvibacter sp. APW13]MDT8989959.1 pyrroline-5-carboxylate reductase [Curvibacter sp. APW13]
MARRIAFIGGGNMASAIIGGLLQQGFPVVHMDVVEPWADARARLDRDFQLTAHAQADAFLAEADMIVWAVKPQMFKEAAAAVAGFNSRAVHLSVMAGIPSDSIARATGNERVIRTMPNTPALIGKGMTALFARSAVTEADRQWATEILASTGATLWLSDEAQLDAVTALSGSGPAYMFFFMEAMTETGVRMGLPREQAYQLAVATFIGAGELARASTEPPEVLRQRVTSKGGTTYAAITSMEASGVKDAFVQAMLAAQKRAQELGQEFGS